MAKEPLYPHVPAGTRKPAARPHKIVKVLVDVDDTLAWFREFHPADKVFFIEDKKGEWHLQLQSTVPAKPRKR